MPAQSRAQRRRANAAAQQRRPSAPQTYETTALPTAEATQPTAPLIAPAPAPASRVARRLRSGTARTLDPIDYTKEYGFVARDLRLIALWTVLLFVAMAALFFARSNGMF